MPSAAVPFVGPSSHQANKKAAVQRTINMHLVPGEKGPTLQSIKGCEVYNGQVLGEVRGVFATLGGRAFAVVADELIEVFADTSVVVLGTLATSAGPVSIALGRTHAVVVDGPNGYAFELATDTFTQISDPAFYGSDWVAYVAARFVFGRPDTDQFYWSDIDDPLTYDALDFATAESSPDGLVWGAEYREELWLLGSGTAEVWRGSASADAAFEKNQGVSISIGCAAGHAVTKIDNGLAWVGQDDNGGAVPYMARGYSVSAIGKFPVSEKFQDQTDISDATAYAYQQDQQVYWCVNIPGLETTWVYEVTLNDWVEHAEFFDGELSQHRFNCHMMAFGSHVFGSREDDNWEARLYTFGDGYVQDNGISTADSPLLRERTSPHYLAPQFNEVFYSRLRLNCSTGTIVDGPKYVEMYYSDDGGSTWTDSALQASLGETGERRTLLQWNRLGKARDRVWRLRCTDDVHFDIVNVDVQAEEGAS